MAICIQCSATTNFDNGLCIDCWKKEKHKKSFVGEIIRNDSEKIVISKHQYMDNTPYIKLDSQYLTIKKTSESAQYKSTGRYLTLNTDSIDSFIQILEKAKHHSNQDSSKKQDETQTKSSSQIKEILLKLKREKKQIEEKADYLKFENIISFMGKTFNCDIETIKNRKDGRSKDKKGENHILLARQITIYLSRVLTNLRPKQIADLCGKQGTPGVVHSCNAIQDKIDTDNDFEKLIANYINEISKSPNDE